MAANLGISYHTLEAAKEQIEAYSRALQGELDKGRQLQQDFLPYSLPQPPGWELAASLKPARDVSGDFYDAFALPGGAVALIIGDVCDKGVGSALFMALCRSLLRIFSIQPQSDSWTMPLSNQPTNPASAGEQHLATSLGPTNLRHAVVFTNNYIAQTHSHTSMFTTLFFGILDPATGLLSYINGGHEPPVILGAGSLKTRLTPTGPAVGLFPDVDFEMRQISLEAGDILIAYTDGVTDARNPSGERFTQERLLSLLEQPFASAAAVLDTVEGHLHGHIADAVQFDDITLLAVQRARTSEVSEPT
jgi:sigma-B regulation protein RsbU (phosphoserine phosphatase)